MLLNEFNDVISIKSRKVNFLLNVLCKPVKICLVQSKWVKNVKVGVFNGDPYDQNNLSSNGKENLVFNNYSK